MKSEDSKLEPLFVVIVSGYNRQSLIDNIFSNRVDEIESTGVITINISDHYPIFSRELRPSLADNVLSINYRVYSDDSLSNFINLLRYTNWEFQYTNR